MLSSVIATYSPPIQM